MIRVGFALILASFLSTQVFAETYFVSPRGNDSSGAGTIESPWRTIKEGLKRMSGGDTLYLRGGIYEEPNIPDNLLKDGLSATRRTIIASYPGERAVFKPTQSDRAGITTSNNREGPNWMTFDGWTVDFSLKVPTLASIPNLKMHSAKNLTFTNMHFINNTNGSLTQIYGQESTGFASNVVVTSCLFSNVQSLTINNIVPNKKHSIYWYKVEKAVFENNIFRDGHSTALHLGSDYLTDSSSNTGMTNAIVRGNDISGFATGIMLSAGVETLVYNNIIRNVQAGGIVVCGLNNRIINNTVYGAGNAGWGGIHVKNSPSGFFSRGNIFVNNIAWNTATGSRGFHIVSEQVGTSYWTNNLARNVSGIWSSASVSGDLIGSLYDPMFVDPPGDLRVADNSPTRGSGERLTRMGLTGIFGFPYLGETAWNIGAFQHEETSHPQHAFVLTLEARDALLLDPGVILEQDQSHSTNDSTTFAQPWLKMAHSNKGWAEFQPSVPADGDYFIWGRVMTVNGNADSFFIAVNDENPEVYYTKFWAPVWQWVRLWGKSLDESKRVRERFSLTKGVNEIRIGSRESDVLISRLLITNDQNFVPNEVSASKVSIQIRSTKYGRVLSWQSTPGASYQVFHSREFQGQPWTKIGETIIAGGPGTEFLVPAEASESGFFWIQVVM